MEKPISRKRSAWKTAAKIAVRLVGLAAVGLATAGYLAVREPAEPGQLAGVSAKPLPVDRAGRAGIDIATGTARVDLAAVGAAWYLNWTYRPDPNLRGEFVPLVCGYPGSQRYSPSRLAADRHWIEAHRSLYPDGTVWLVGNEVGYAAQHDTRSPAQYAADFHDCYQMLKAINPTWQVSVGPAVLSTNPLITKGQRAGTGLNYLRQVIGAYQEAYGQTIPAQYFAATAYVAPHASRWSLFLHAHHRLDVTDFVSQVRNLRTLLAAEGLRDRQVILTEFGDPFAGGQPPQTAQLLIDAATYAATATDPTIGCPTDSDHLVQRWGWYVAQPLPTLTKITRLGGSALIFDLAQTALFSREGRLTYLGHIYAQLTGHERSTTDGGPA
jgi:hypothetical protein